MTTPIQGLPGNIVGTIASPVAIASSTDATPIVVTTAAAHGIRVGDGVLIQGHQTNVGANGIHIADAGTVGTTLVLKTSVGSGAGAGGATGSTQSTALGPNFNAPADNDNETAASVNVPFEALADRAGYIFYVMSRELFRLGTNNALTSAALNQVLDTTYRQHKIPGVLTGNATFHMLPGTFDGQEMGVYRDIASIDAHTVSLVGPGGNAYGLAGSQPGWIRFSWDATRGDWYSCGNGANWTGTHVLT